jgi:hypothetical protein
MFGSALGSASEAEVSFEPTPVMAGGTGRSGTTVIAGLIGRHPEARASVPREIKVLTEPGGVLDICVGAGARRQVSMRSRALGLVPALQHRALKSTFTRQMRGRWWERSNRKGRSSGLHLCMDESTRDALVDQFLTDLDAMDSLSAGRLFTERLIRAQHQHAGESWWLDTSPPNIAEAARIHRLLPQARFIWMVRDGRATAASVMAERWWPDGAAEAIAWWERNLRWAHLGASAVPDDAVLVVSLEDLVVLDREGTYGRVLSFLGLEDHPATRRFFERRMPADRVRLDGWRDRVPDASDFERRYRTAAERLEAAGVSVHERSPA